MCSIQTFLILLVKFGAQLIYATVKLISWHLSFCSQRGCREAPGLLTYWFATDDTSGFQSTWGSLLLIPKYFQVRTRQRNGLQSCWPAVSHPSPPHGHVSMGRGGSVCAQLSTSQGVKVLGAPEPHQGRRWALAMGQQGSLQVPGEAFQDAGCFWA